MIDLDTIRVLLWVVLVVGLALSLAVMFWPFYEEWSDRRRRARRGGMLR